MHTTSIHTHIHTSGPQGLKMPIRPIVWNSRTENWPENERPSESHSALNTHTHCLADLLKCVLVMKNPLTCQSPQKLSSWTWSTQRHTCTVTLMSVCIYLNQQAFPLASSWFHHSCSFEWIFQQYVSVSTTCIVSFCYKKKTLPLSHLSCCLSYPPEPLFSVNSSGLWHTFSAMYCTYTQLKYC